MVEHVFSKQVIEQILIHDINRKNILVIFMADHFTVIPQLPVCSIVVNIQAIGTVVAVLIYYIDVENVLEIEIKEPL